MTKGKMVAWVTGFLTWIGRAVLALVTKDRLDRGKRYLNVWTRRYPVEFFAGVAGVALGLWVLSPVYMRLFFGDDAGTKGDSFGALTSFFTGAAFVGLIATLMQQQREIRMQRQDLKLQRDEMKETRGVLAGQNEQMELQNRSLRQQMFEQTFFNLLNVFNQYIQKTNERLESRATNKHGLFKQAISTVEAACRDPDCKRRVRVGLESHQPKLEGELWVLEYAVYYLSNIEKQPLEIKPYYRLLYNLLNLVDKSAVKEKQFYTNLLRAQLSDSELNLIALHCARSEGEELRILVERYDVVEHPAPKLNGQNIHQICEEIRRLDAEGA